MIDTILHKFPNVLLVLLIMLPNILFFFLPPQNIPTRGEHKDSVSNVLNFAESAGRLAIFLLPIFYNFKVNRLPDKMILGIILMALVFYYILWSRFFLRQRDYLLLFSPFLFIPVPLAIFPVLYFAGAAILLRSIPLFFATAIFATGHIPNSYREYLNSNSK